jgi:hypothetical protein
VTHCVHCQIRFLTHPRNAGRRNLRCPFGCRDHHRRQRASQRSTAYYQTVSGRRERKRLNVARLCRSRCATDGELLTLSVNVEDASSSECVIDAERVDDALPPEMELKLEFRLSGIVLDETSLENASLLAYLRMIVNQIEGTKRSQDELVDLLHQSMRQHSLSRRTKIAYVLRFLHQHPP